MNHQLRPVQPPLLGDLLGLKRPDGPMYGACLPGALMPELFRIPQTFIPAGFMQAPVYALEESYSLTPESSGYRPRLSKPAKTVNGDEASIVEYERVTLFDRARELRPHERPAPPATPGFWDHVHVERSGLLSNPRHRLRRMIGGLRMYYEATGALTLLAELGRVVAELDIAEKLT